MNHNFSTIVTIKIGKVNVELIINYNGYSGSINCNNDQIEFNGIVSSFDLNYNETSICFWHMSKEFKFFQEEMREKIDKVLVKAKILKKSKS